MIEWLESLRDACDDGERHARRRRVRIADDVEGWIALLGESGDEGAEARDALDADRAPRARGQELGDRRRGAARSHRARRRRPGSRAAAAPARRGLRDRARRSAPRVRGRRPRRARSRPRTTPPPQRAEKLAAATGGWADLVTEASEIATEAHRSRSSPRSGGRASVAGTRSSSIASTTRCRAASRARARSRTNRAAYAALAEAYRKQQKWADLADTLRRTPRSRPTRKTKVDLLIDLGDLLRDPARVDREGDRGVPAGRPISTRTATTRSPRSSGCTAATRSGRTSRRSSTAAPRSARRPATRVARPRFVASSRTMRAEKLGDLEGAIARYEAAVAAERQRCRPRSRRSSISTTRPAAPTTTSARWSGSAQVAPEGEKLATLRKLAAELEDRDPARARDAYEKLLAADPNADDAYRGLERVLEAEENWYELVALSRAATSPRSRRPPQRVELYLALRRSTSASSMIRTRRSRPAERARDRRARTRPRSPVLPRALRRAPRRSTARSTSLVQHAALEGDRARRSTPRPAGSRSRT